MRLMMARVVGCDFGTPRNKQTPPRKSPLSRDAQERSVVGIQHQVDSALFHRFERPVVQRHEMKRDLACRREHGTA